jgi:hypothetical protein
MKAAVIIFSIALVALGMWMMANTFLGKDEPRTPGAAPASQTIRAAEQQTAGPAVIGFALIAGGVLLLIVAARRKA